jgi:hypothetical protein
MPLSVRRQIQAGRLLSKNYTVPNLDIQAMAQRKLPALNPAAKAVYDQATANFEESKRGKSAVVVNSDYLSKAFEANGRKPLAEKAKVKTLAQLITEAAQENE